METDSCRCNIHLLLNDQLRRYLVWTHRNVDSIDSVRSELVAYDTGSNPELQYVGRWCGGVGMALLRTLLPWRSVALYVCKCRRREWESEVLTASTMRLDWKGSRDSWALSVGSGAVLLRWTFEM